MSFVFSALTGVLSGFGVGGGTLLIIFMTNFMGLSPVEARGINLIYFIPAAAASLIGHIKNRLVDWWAFFLTLAPALLTTLAASLLIDSLNPSIVKKLFGAFLIVVGAYEIFGKRKS